jgi:hypothetical protein
MSVIMVLAFLGSLAVSGIPSASAGPRVRYNLYFGDLHTHTIYSDAWTGTPWDAFAAAIAGGADFMATTDHDSYGYWISPEEWADTLAAAEFYTSRTFVAMAGYELWIACAGEINVFNTADFPPVPKDPERRPTPGCDGAPGDVLPAFYDWLADQPGAVGQWNHPTYVTHNFHDFAFWDRHRDVGMGLIEVWNDNWFYTEESYVLALDQGWHVMPTANSDTHGGDWISAWELRTVLLAPRLTPTDLYGAMAAGRGYATADRNLRIDYTLNGQVMGSSLSPAPSYTASVHVEEPDGASITLLEIVSDGGKVVAQFAPNRSVVDWTLTLTSDSAHYYYVRVSTASRPSSVLADFSEEGITAVTAPVWTGR